MKLLIPILFVLFSNPEISEIRKMYPDAAKSKTAADAFYTKLSGVATTDSDKSLVAYKGSAIALKGKFLKKISDKKKHLAEGAKLVEAAIKSEPKNIELRMIRLSIQETLPLIVKKYRKNIKEDKELILGNYKALDGEMKEYLKNFILVSTSFSKADKQAAKQE